MPSVSERLAKFNQNLKSKRQAREAPKLGAAGRARPRVLQAESYDALYLPKREERNHHFPL